MSLAKLLNVIILILFTIGAALPGTAFTKTDPELRDGSVDDSAGAGGSSLSPEAARALVDAGADVFRLNFSHGSHAEHQARVASLTAYLAKGAAFS